MFVKYRYTKFEQEYKPLVALCIVIALILINIYTCLLVYIIIWITSEYKFDSYMNSCPFLVNLITKTYYRTHIRSWIRIWNKIWMRVWFCDVHTCMRVVCVGGPHEAHTYARINAIAYTYSFLASCQARVEFR